MTCEKTGNPPHVKVGAAVLQSQKQREEECSMQAAWQDVAMSGSGHKTAVAGSSFVCSVLELVILGDRPAFPACVNFGI